MSRSCFLFRRDDDINCNLNNIKNRKRIKPNNKTPLCQHSTNNKNPLDVNECEGEKTKYKYNVRNLFTAY